MDVFAHFFWAYSFLHRTKRPWLGALVGVLPDLVIFVPFMIIRIIAGNLQFGKPNINTIPNYIFIGYNFTHSLLIAAIVFGIIYLIKKKVYLFMLGWPIHILLDIPTHTRAFFPTKFLYPLSEFTVNGVNWGTPWFMILNYSLLIITLIMIFLVSKKKLTS